MLPPSRVRTATPACVSLYPTAQQSMLEGHDTPKSDWMPLGIADELGQLLTAAGSVEQFAADLRDRWIDQLVIAGDLAHCADRIASLADQGIDHVILGFPAGTTPGQQDTASRQLIAAVAGSLP